jgi:hypothetical protein
MQKVVKTFYLSRAKISCILVLQFVHLQLIQFRDLFTLRSQTRSNMNRISARFILLRRYLLPTKTRINVSRRIKTNYRDNKQRRQWERG